MKKQVIVLCGTVLGSVAFARGQQFGTLSDNFGNSALNVAGTVGPAPGGLASPYDPYEFTGVSTSEFDAISNQGVPRNWIAINNSSSQQNSTNTPNSGPGSGSAYWANPWTGYSWNKNDGAVMVSPTGDANFVSTGDRTTASTYPAVPGIGSSWLVSAPVKFQTGQTFSFMVDARAANQDYLEVRISTFGTAAAAMAVPNTGVVLTGSEAFTGISGTANDGSSYQNVGDFKTVLKQLGTLDTTSSDYLYGEPAASPSPSMPTSWTLETATVPASANGMYGRIGFYYFDQKAGQDAPTSYVVGVTGVNSTILQITANLVQWGLGVAPNQSWNNKSNWAGANPTLNGGIPSGQGAQILFGGLPNQTYSAYGNLIADPGAQTISLDAAQTIGQLTFDNASDSYTISPGTGGTLTIDDTGDLSGVNPRISVVHGNHFISAPIALANGVSISLQNSSMLTISNAITGTSTNAIRLVHNSAPSLHLQYLRQK